MCKSPSPFLIPTTNMGVKKYNLIYLNRLDTSVFIDGEQISIHFNPEYKYNDGRTIPGYFVTGNEVIQKAMEKDNSFNVLWELEPNTETEPEAVTSAPDVIEADPEPATTTEAILETSVQVEITNYTQAKIFIRSKFPELTHNQVISAEKLIQVANEKGITFPNWKL